MSYTPSDADKMSGAVKLTLTSTGNNCLPVSDTMTLSIVPSPIVSLPNVIYIKQGDSKVLEPVITGSAVQYLWTPNLYLSSATVNKPIITGVESKLYTLTATGASGCIGSGQVQVNVLKPIIVPNTFTPNGDGINDVWVIKELANYPGNEVIIFNRYGTKLYSSRGYAVPWDGTYGGKSVPFGTYYYIINMGIYGVPVAGYVTVVR
jgi:gliding motility-associated-like protein